LRKFKLNFMKNYLLIFSIALLSFSCSQSNDPEPNQANCDCDKVVEKTTFNVVGTPQNPAINYHTVYTTINECTHIQRSKTYDTTDPSLIPQIGQCR
jgi:hypothetical protein